MTKKRKVPWWRRKRRAAVYTPNRYEKKLRARGSKPR